MGVFTIVKSLFSNSKTTNDIFDKDNGHLAKFGEWVGNINYTEEEKAEFTHKFVIDTLGENTERSKARREISRLVIRLWCAIIAGAAIVYPWNPSWSGLLFTLATSGPMMGIVGAISLFFFGTHMMRASKYGNKDGK